jgi:hypothetical protein
MGRGAFVARMKVKKMAEAYQFKDPNLAGVFQRNASQFKNFKSNLDNSSADIKNLEKWLQNSGICFHACVYCDKGMSLAWSNLTGDWRIISRCPPDDGELAEEDEHEGFCRPLIEMPIKTRIEARPYLPRLVEEIAKIVAKSETDPAQASFFAIGQPKEQEDLDAMFSSEDEIPF